MEPVGDRGSRIRQAEYDLLPADEFFRSLTATSMEGTLVVDRDGRVRFINRPPDKTPGCCWWPPGSLGSGDDETIGRCRSCGSNAGSECARCPGYGACVCRAAREAGAAALTAGAAITEGVPIRFGIDDHLKTVDLTLSAAPLSYGADELAIVVIENLAKIRSAYLWSRAGETGLYGMVGRHPKMLQLFEQIGQVGPLNVPVVIQGESGSGKEMVAQALHLESSRRDRRLVAVNCGALAEGVLESELFGHARGAFSGAVRDKKGRFELADGGTIFLDEIGELTPAMQVKLLRVLQDGTFERVGGEDTLKPDCRVLCATNRNLETEVAKGRFREDLWYRLGVVTVDVPALRERREDIPLLARHLLGKAAGEFGVQRPEISRPALDALMAYAWPGNVRELENSLRHALIRCDGKALEQEHLPASVCSRAAPGERERRQRRLGPDRIAEALRRSRGNKAQAARLLGVGRATLYRHLGSSTGNKS